MDLKIQIKRLFYKIIAPIRNIYWFIFRPKTYGAKMLIEHEGKFLMIRNSYGSKNWTFPGGGKNSNELPEEAAKREAFEEVGIALPDVQYLGAYFNERQYKKDTVYCFYKKVNSDYYRIDDDEVEEARWFDKSNLPLSQSRSVKWTVDLYVEHSKRK